MGGKCVNRCHTPFRATQHNLNFVVPKKIFSLVHIVFHNSQPMGWDKRVEPGNVCVVSILGYCYLMRKFSTNNRYKSITWSPKENKMGIILECYSQAKSIMLVSPYLRLFPGKDNNV